MLIKTEILSFDITEYPFHKLMSSFIGEKDLDELIAETEELKNKNSFYKNMESTLTFKKLYQSLNGKEGEKFYKLYQSFIKKIIRPQYKEPIYYQIKPSHRILYKDIRGEARFHRDSDYGHNTHEINYWIPQTSAFDSNSIWIEKNQGKKDYQALNLKIGEYVKFSGANLSHGAAENKTNRTRVSFDFRIIPESKFELDLVNGNDVNTMEDSKNPVMSNARKFERCE